MTVRELYEYAEKAGLLDAELVFSQELKLGYDFKTYKTNCYDAIRGSRVQVGTRYRKPVYTDSIELVSYHPGKRYIDKR